MDEDHKALFIRLPLQEAQHLDAKVKELGRSKQSVVVELINRGLLAVTSVPKDAPASEDEVLTTEEAAVLLKVTKEQLVQRVELGDVPHRRFGFEYRFSRQELLTWMGGNDHRYEFSVGFKSPS